MIGRIYRRINRYRSSRKNAVEKELRKKKLQEQFRGEFETFSSLPANQSDRLQIRWEDRHPCLNDKTSATEFDGHYVYHTAWAARKLAELKPEEHIDISSFLYFATIASAIVPIKFYDYRPAGVKLSNFTAEHADLLSLPFPDGSIQSLSCMHVIEHIGLGRYGDNLDRDGDLKAIAELQRVLAPGGALLFAVPIGGVAKVMFNAHRIYTYAQIVEQFSGFELLEFSLIPDGSESKGMIQNASESMAGKQRYGCGCFCFRKPPANNR